MILEKMVLDHYDKMIIHFLGNRGKSNTNEIAENLKISWKTANEHLYKLNQLGFVNTMKIGKIVYWILNY